LREYLASLQDNTNYGKTGRSAAKASRNLLAEVPSRRLFNWGQGPANET
jgi:hypothetical protein